MWRHMSVKVFHRTYQPIIYANAYAGKQQQEHQCYELLAICAGIPVVTGGCPSQRVMWNVYPCYDVIIVSGFQASDNKNSVFTSVSQWYGLTISIHLMFTIQPSAFFYWTV